jgi:hypothetical protein
MSYRTIVGLALFVTTAVYAGASQAQPHVAAADSGASTSPTSVSAEALVKLVAQRKLWPLKAETADNQLGALGPWKREQPIPEALTLVAGHAGIVERSEVSYAADAKKRWIFLGASFFVGDPDLARLHRTLSDLLRQQLGKPAWTRKAKTKGDLPAVGWKLGKRLELLLTKSPVEGERLLALVVSEPQGGSGD